MLGLARRLEKTQQRWQQGDAGEESDEHADTGNQAELGHTLVGSRR